MLQALNNTNITRRQRCCYGHLSIGNLGRTNLGRVSCPLQQQFADIDTCISVPVHHKPTGLASVNPVIAADFIQNLASATSFGSMIGIDSNNINLLLDCDNSKGLPELKVGDFVDNSIGFSAFGISEFPSNSQILQIFNDNMRNIELISQFDNLVAYLEAPCFDEVKFNFSYSSQTFQSPIAESGIINTFEFVFSNLNLSPLMLNILPKIDLPQDFSLFVDNAQGEAVSINVNPHNVSFILADKFLFDTNLQNPFISFDNLAGFENPAICNMAFKSIEQSVLGNRQNNPLAFYNSRESKERGFPFGFSISKHFGTELNRQSLDFITEFSSVPNKTSRTDNCICSQQSKFSPAFLVGGVM